LVDLVQQEAWHLTVVDANGHVVAQKLGAAPNTTLLSFDIADAAQRAQAVAQADLVLSLLPPALHILVAQDCIAAKKSLLTASYVDGD
jgi:saccharopine dehydrogenase-like NADP-dependent oxidoreductase